MKIVVIAPTHLPAQRANTIQVMKMSAALVSNGHVVKLLVPGRPSQPVEWELLARHYGITQKFPVEWLPACAAMRRYEYGYMAVRRAQIWGADLVYTRLPQAAALASYWGLRTVFEVHDIPQGWLGPRLLHFFGRCRGGQRLVAITHALADDLERLGFIPTREDFLYIAPDGVDIERFEGLPAPQRAREKLIKAGFGFEPGNFTAGYTGSLYAGRGADMLMDVAAQVPAVQFVFVGGEPGEVYKLQQAVEQRGLLNVLLLSFVPNRDLPLFQAACDILLMPYQEHVAASSGGDIARYLSPMKLFEYMACERPILASDLPVLQEVLNSDNALLLPRRDVSAWVDAILQVQANPEQYAGLSRQARLDASKYSWTARARNILQGLVE